MRELTDWLALTTVEREQPRSRYARISAPDLDSTPADLAIAAVARLVILGVFVMWAVDAKSTGFRVIFAVFSVWWIGLTVFTARHVMRDRAAVAAELASGTDEPRQ